MRRMAVIMFMLLCSMKISTTHGSKECNPSRCGNQDIGYPFTLKGDPSNCTGDEKYKLLCIGNKTFMGAPYDNYLVTNIFYDNSTINIVNTELASGKCSLPSQAITPSFFPKGFYLTVDFWWNGFINCSEKLDSDFYGAAIPCLSQNNIFIYLAPSSGIYSLAKSCTYLTMVPFPVLYHADIFGTMKNGFSIAWPMREKIPRSKIIHHCLNQAMLLQHWRKE